MLVLTRFPIPETGEDTIDIEGGIRIRILSIIGQRVKVGIECPKELAITRPDAVKRPRPQSPGGLRNPDFGKKTPDIGE